jgi:hypothetical protein
MSVEFEPVSKSAFEFGVSNKTWFSLVNTSEIATLIGEQGFNDPLVIGKDVAIKCAEAVKAWTPPEGWFMAKKELEGKQMFIEFFVNCGGFKTY